MASRRSAAAIDRRTVPLGAVCAFAAYAVADCLVSSKLKQKPWLLLTFELPEADDRGGDVYSQKRPAGSLMIIARRCGRSIR
jgi:hypothetical protein